MTDTTQAAGLTDEQMEMIADEAILRVPGSNPVGRILYAIRAALAAQAEPAGYRLVPVDLIRRAQHAINWHLEPTSPNEHEATMLELSALGWPEEHAIVKTMLAASPAPAEAKEEQPRANIRTDDAWARVEQKFSTPQPQAAQPVAWQVCWVSGGMRRRSKPFELENDARVYASMIMGNTEVRPLYDHAAPALTEEQEREAFEEWAESEDFDLSVSWGNQQYTDGATQTAWDAWKARAALRSTQGGE